MSYYFIIQYKTTNIKFFFCEVLQKKFEGSAFVLNFKLEHEREVLRYVGWCLTISSVMLGIWSVCKTVSMVGPIVGTYDFMEGAVPIFICFLNFKV